MNISLKQYYVIFFSCISFYLSADFVTCNLQGQLGNQLFQVAATLAYSWDHNVEALFPDLNNKDPIYKFVHHRNTIFAKLNSSNLPGSILNKYESIDISCSADGGLQEARIPFQRSMLLVGGFMFWPYFDRYKEEILSVFECPRKIRRLILRKYSKLLKLPNTVSVHVRTFTPELHEQGLATFVGLNYFKDAFAIFPSDTVFVVFSDRIKWCKNNFSKLFPERTFIFIEGNDEVTDLYLMSKMKNYIVSNSTFSWWGAYLNKDSSKIVVCPGSLGKPSPGYTYSCNTFFFDDWVVVIPDWEEPYPKDMRSYEKSKSLDNQ